MAMGRRRRRPKPAAPPDHSTISRTRRLIDLETHHAVFTWILQRLAAIASRTSYLVVSTTRPGDLYGEMRPLLDDEEHENFVAAATRLSRRPQIIK